MPFTPEAIASVHTHSGGSPRVINTLCDNALFEAYLARSNEISGEMIDQIGKNLALAHGVTGLLHFTYGSPGRAPRAQARSTR